MEKHCHVQCHVKCCVHLLCQILCLILAYSCNSHVKSVVDEEFAMEAASSTGEDQPYILSIFLKKNRTLRKKWSTREEHDQAAP